MTRLKIPCAEDGSCFLEMRTDRQRSEIRVSIECAEDEVVDIRATRRSLIDATLTPAKIREMARFLLKFAKEIENDDGA